MTSLAVSPSRASMLLRPAGPVRIHGGDIDQDIAVDENRPQSSPRVRAMISSVDMRTVALPRRRCTIRSPRLSPFGRGGHEPDGPVLEHGTRPRSPAGAPPLADRLRDRHLTFAGDAHRPILTSIGKSKTWRRHGSSAPCRPIPRPGSRSAREGLLVRPGGFFVDPLRPVRRAVITHGHSDHARPGHRTVIATPETLAIMARAPGRRGRARAQAPGLWPDRSSWARCGCAWRRPATCSARPR